MKPAASTPFASLQRRAAALAVSALLSLAVLPACKFTALTSLPGDLPAGIMPATFTTPLPQTYANASLGANQIAAELQKRGSVANMKGKMRVYTGTLSAMGTQSFDMLCGMDRAKQSLRLRASRQYGTLFDLLVANGKFEAVNYAEKTTVAGTVAQLERNPDLTAGIMPTMLFDVIAIQDTLLARLTGGGRVNVRDRGAYYVIKVRYGVGQAAERFFVRKGDLLVVRYDRYRDYMILPDKMLFSAEYTGYRTTGKKAAVLPSGFIISAFRGQVGAIVESAEANIKLPSGMFIMESRPEGFKPVSL